MIEDEILDEIKQERAEKCEEPYLFPREKWDELIHWQPVSNIPVEEIYKDLPEVKQYHDNYCSFWLRDKKRAR